MKLTGKSDIYIFNPDDKKAVLNTKGKVGSVYLGKRESDNMPVIIKRINAPVIKNCDDLDRFLTETKLKISHPDIVNTIEHIIANKNLYIIREYVQGIDLKQALKKRKIRKKFNTQFYVKCIIKVLESLDSLHKQNIFHCDIKPSNIILKCNNSTDDIDINDPQIKLIDLGMARSMKKYNIKFSSSPFALIYSPPEQVLNINSLINATTDIYSTAITLYELIINKPAFDNDNPLILISLQTVYPLTKDKKIPVELFKVLLKASNKYPFPKPPHMYKGKDLLDKLIEGQEGRYSNVKDFIEALKDLKL